jgi:hypothetical protein
MLRYQSNAYINLLVQAELCAFAKLASCYDNLACSSINVCWSFDDSTNHESCTGKNGTQNETKNEHRLWPSACKMWTGLKGN